MCYRLILFLSLCICGCDFPGETIRIVDGVSWCYQGIQNSCLKIEFEDVVISVGGGTPCFFDNVDYMNSVGETVFLDVLKEGFLIHKVVVHSVDLPFSGVPGGH